MVTGQSLVLWSRLHLVCRSTWKLRIILGMIIVNGVCMHGPQFVFSLVVRPCIHTVANVAADVAPGSQK